MGIIWWKHSINSITKFWGLSVVCLKTKHFRTSSYIIHSKALLRSATSGEVSQCLGFLACNNWHVGHSMFRFIPSFGIQVMGDVPAISSHWRNVRDFMTAGSDCILPSGNSTYLWNMADLSIKDEDFHINLQESTYSISSFMFISSFFYHLVI
jgi:hypothetical protein